MADRRGGCDAGSLAATATTMTGLDLRRLREGVRAGAPFGVASCLLSVSFGVVAQDAGLSPLAAIVMSAIVFAGSAQFAAIAIVSSGGGLGAAIGAAALMNSRFLPMGVALGPSLPGGPVARGLQGQAVVDSSWAQAANGDGTFDRWLLFGSTAVQYVGWVGGTVIGALAGDALGDPKALGLDALYPAFFVALLVSEARSGRARGVALLGAVLALALVPVAPPGLPVLAASLAALIGLTRSARAEAARVAEGAQR
jgi:predicted branched-subunit amino acid permease